MKLVHKRIEIGAAILVLIAIICSLWVGYLRIGAEEDYKRVNLMVDEADVRAFANGLDKSNTEILKTMKAHHVSQVLCKETSLGDLITAGDALAYEGQAIRTFEDAAVLPSDMPINEANLYLILLDRSWIPSIKDYGMPKLPGMKLYDNGRYAVLAIPRMLPSDDKEEILSRQGYESIGIGFNMKLMDEITKSGLEIVPQIRSWKYTDDPSLKALRHELESLPKFSMLLFNDQVLPGVPESLRALAAMLQDKEGNPKYSVVTIEFNDQKGLPKLSVLLDKNTVRLHTIANGEMKKFTGDTSVERKAGEVEAIDRFTLAAKEREMRALLVRFFNINQPGASFNENMVYLDRIADNLLDAGFTLDQPIGKLVMPPTPTPLTLLIGLGVAAGVVLLLLSLGFTGLALGAGIVLYLGWLLGYFLVDPTLSLKALAFISVVTFPTLSCITLFPKERLSALKSVGRLLLMSLMSLIGAILMVGLLSEPLFMLKLDYFSGVKLAHLLPILIVPIVVYIWRDPRPIETAKGILEKALDYKWAILGAILFAAIAIYLARTGNDGVQVSDQENFMRQYLTDVLGVRPRSKEFLIGYPATLLFFYFAGNRKPFWILSIPVVIGQVSLVNTYAHLHTPLLISLHRSFNGLLLGIILGLVAIAVVKGCLKLAQHLSSGGGHQSE